MRPSDENHVFTCAGIGEVAIPLSHAVHSGVVQVLVSECSPPHAPVALPEWVGQHIFGLPRILSHAHHTPTSRAMSSDTQLLAELCVECVPGLSMQVDAARLTLALAWLKVCRFLDIEHGIRLLFGYVRHALGGCETVEDLVDMLYEGDVFKNLCLDDQGRCYKKLLAERDALTGYVGGVDAGATHDEHELPGGSERVG